ncbi:MAG: [acyl-carrier-protein] S-malonyltransferase [Hydrogenophilales bacterium 12-61-10]|nr:MAG: [acyl-carrier-protein] S-malonyltransferase [Hydrogenophilales bacterium 12-61-10]OYX27953.1 MAG: [acyl-carrier-protein] S-malonyltransferase [Hydrogenophilales bacterium 32-62-9]
MATHNLKLAFVFPGQGSQSVGMMQGWGERPDVRATFTEASDALGQDLWAMVADGPIELLNQTVNTQPAMLAADIAAWRVWQAAGGATPALLAGHSLGEYAALVAAGALGFADAIRLVRFRAEAMQAAVPDGVGAMAAILGMEDDAVRAVCSEAAAGEVVEAVNFNSPGQVVIAGNKAAVERAMVLAKEKGAKRALPLPVSVPSHSSLMLPAAEKLLAHLQGVTIAMPLIPVLHNTDVHSQADADAIRLALARQLHTPVRWVETVQALKAAGIDRVIECGPGKVLAGLNKRIDDSLPAVALVDETSLVAALNQ